MTLFIYLLQVTTCLAIFYAFYHLFLRKETLFHTNRMYLMTTLILSLILPLVKIYIDAQQTASNVVVASSVYVGNFVNQFSATISSPHPKSFPWLTILSAIYLTGVAVMAVRLLLAFKQILEIRKGGIRTIVNEHTCMLSDQVRSPFSFFNTIYLPANHSFGEEELNEVIAHETAHVSGWHTWDVLLMELLCIKLWPSPMIYLYRKSLKEVHEYVADAAVLKETPWENYAQLLVSQQHNQLQNILSNQLIYSQLKKRLLMMNKERSDFAARYKYLGIIPVLLITLILFSFKEKTTEGTALTDVGNLNQHTEELILLVAADHKLYFGLNEISKDKLVSAVKEITKGMANPEVRVIAEDNHQITAGELGEILEIGSQMHMRWFFDTNEEGKYDSYISSLLTGKAHFEADTLPENTSGALRLKEPMQTPAIPEDYTKLDYTLPMPVFPGCDEVTISERGMCGMEKLAAYINAHMVYPESMKKDGKEGRVLVKFVVDANGYIKDVAIQQSLDPAADQAVLNLINGMNTGAGKWRPARNEGKSYDAEMVLPVTFSLDNSTAQSEPLMYAEELPRFPGCEDIGNPEERSTCAQRKLYEFIYSNIMYPKEDRDNNIQGHCIVQFVIGVDGSISDINVRRSPSDGMTKEVERIMNAMAAMPEKWTPARNEGKAVAMRFTLPVKFKLQDDDVPNPTDQKNGDGPDKGLTLKLTPNPAKETITVSIFEDTHTLKIFDTSGNQVMSRKADYNSTGQEILNISGLKPGQYVVQVIGTSQTISGTFTVIK